MDRGYIVERKVHPKDTAGIFSLLTFRYIHDYVKRGNVKDLDEDDVCQVMKRLQSKNLGDKIEAKYEELRTTSKKVSVLKLILKTFFLKYFLLGCFQLSVKILYVTLTPYSVGKLVNYFKKGQTEISRDDAFFYGGIVIFTNAFFLAYEHHYSLLICERGVEVIASLSSLIYRKALKLSPATLAEISNGKIVTAITKDVVSIEEAIYFVNDLWVELSQSTVVLYLLYSRVGVSAVLGLSLVLFIMIFQLYLGTVIYKKRAGANAKSDERLELTQEVLTSIRVIKMYTWGRFFKEKLIVSRKKEIQKLRSLTLLKFTVNLLGQLCNKLSFLLILIVYIWFGNPLTSDIVYYVITCFIRIRRAIAFIIPVFSTTTAELFASLNRLSNILNADEIAPSDKDDKAIIIPKIDFISVDISVGKISLLHDVNMKLKPGLNVLIGLVGCGKSALIKAVLGEYNVNGGKCNIEGTISYAPQNPWVFPSSIKQNILFGQPYNETKYKKILEICALQFDLDGLANGDDTILSDCGVNLSKGQQTRVNIARAMYKDSDIYIIDDSLSSLDSSVKNYIFKNCIQDYLKDKLVLLATHDTKLVEKSNNVIIMLNGTVTYSGKPNNIPEKLTQSLESLDHNLLDDEVEEEEIPKKIEDEKTIDENTKLIAEICSSTKANVYHEVQKTGSVGWKEYKKYFAFGGGIKIFLLVVFIYGCTELTAGLAEKMLNRWVMNEEQIAFILKNNVSSNATIPASVFNSTNNLMLSTSNAFNSSTNLMSSTSNAFNSTTNLMLSTTTFTTSNITQSASYETTQRMTTWQFENSTQFDNNSTLISKTTEQIVKTISNTYEKLADLYADRFFYIQYYSMLLVTSCFMGFVAISIYFVFSLKVSKNLHKSMVANILGSTMAFFDTNMSGNVLNRFSKDLFQIDEWIPYVIFEAIKMSAMMGTTIIIISSINTTFTVLSIILLMIFATACNYFIRPGRSLKRLDNATRSPMIGHLNATLDGLVTIRAYGTQKILADEFDKHQDISTAAHHLFLILSKCLAFSLHMVSACFIAVIILYFLLDETNDSSANVGMAVTQSFILSNFLDWGLRQWLYLESLMTSFQRASEYTDIKQENQTGQKTENWPTEGCIQYKNVSLVYRKNNEKVLKNLNFTIKPKEKIGIVGRTGAGKSSIIVTLFRLYEVDGDILIDNVPIKTLPLDYLRTHVGIIPQDPILFTGTVRSNVDPTGIFSDDEIWYALGAVNLKPYIQNLDDDIRDSGIIHSVGQRQLVCLARAIIRKTKIIILDEATANMDEETDTFIHNKIDELFEDCTTITVAHRLHSVMRCDRIMVMDKGEISEFDSPQNLLNNKDSAFYKMVYPQNS